jgi:hypothetical protein
VAIGQIGIAKTRTRIFCRSQAVPQGEPDQESEHFPQRPGSPVVDHLIDASR